MKAYKVTYKHGHFIEKVTGKRIIPVQGMEYIINAEDAAFNSEDEKLDSATPLSREEKANRIAEKYSKNGFKKLLNVNTVLIYRIGNSKKVEGDEGIEYLFSCRILEDLYIYQTKPKGKDKSGDWRLCECLCQLEKCIDGNLTLSDEITTTSLNKLYSSTVMFYFVLQRSASANAFDTFFLMPENGDVTMYAIKNHHYTSLGDLRQKFIEIPHS